MRSIIAILVVSAAASVLSACSAPQNTDSAQAHPATQTAQGCSPGEMVNVAGSRLKQPCGSQPVQTSASLGSNGR